ncbi:MAG: alpha/beta hydrolase [Phycisphaeraceae bacterium]|nr:alpha/beta hydrolase [Phycisphaeraceae bacterium]
MAPTPNRLITSLLGVALFPLLALCQSAAPNEAAIVSGLQTAGASGSWRDPSQWPARFGRTIEEPIQGVVIELPAGRTTHAWRAASATGALARGWWDTASDGERLLNGQAATSISFAEPIDGVFGFHRETLKPNEPPESLPPAAAMLFVSGQRVDTPRARLAPETVSIERTWFSLYDPTKGPARGIAIVMPGLFGTPEAVFDQVVRHFQSRRWVVLRMMAQPSRYTERLTLSIDPVDTAAAASRLASTFDQRAAECAYAVEAALAWAESSRPEIRNKPRVILGGSGGAMSLPPVVARRPGSFHAAVLIAGGADFATIAATSNYEEWVDSVRLRWGDRKGTPAEVEALSRAYLAHARLDAYHTAEALKGTPMLFVQASRDRAVPAQQQELLWERLGRPERRLLNVGHETLFVSLPLRMSGIMDWIDKALNSAERGQDAEPHHPPEPE